MNGLNNLKRNNMKAKEIIIVKNEFFELPKIDQRRVLILLINWTIKRFIETFKKK